MLNFGRRYQAILFTPNTTCIICERSIETSSHRSKKVKGCDEYVCQPCIRTGNSIGHKIKLEDEFFFIKKLKKDVNFFTSKRITKLITDFSLQAYQKENFPTKKIFTLINKTQKLKNCYEE